MVVKKTAKKDIEDNIISDETIRLTGMRTSNGSGRALCLGICSSGSRRIHL